MKKLKNELKNLYLEKAKLDYEKKKEYWERYIVKIENPVLFVEKKYGEFIIRPSKTMKEVYFNARIQIKDKDLCFFSEWIKDPKMRSYHRVDFCPPPLQVPSHVYNTWEGFVAENFDPDDVKDYPYIKELIKALSNYEPEVENYIYNYLAHLVQKPGELPRTAIFMQSAPGVGKNLFFENFCNKMLGNQYLLVTTNIDDIIGTFPLTKGKLVVCLDEANAGDTFSKNNKVKGHITQEYEFIQKKGIDGVKTLNCNRMFGFTNENNSFKVEEGDRRIFATRCSSKYKGNSSFFINVLNEFKNIDCVNQFYQDLKNRDISGFNAEIDRPTTELYKELKSISISNEVRFLYEYAVEFSGEDESRWIQANHLYNHYKTFCTENHFTPRNSKTFYSALLRELKRGKKHKYKTRDSKAIKYLIDTPDIKAWIKEFVDYL